MKTLLKLLTLITLSFLFTACGGGGTISSSDSDNNISDESSIENNDSNVGNTTSPISDDTAQGIGGIEKCTGDNLGFDASESLSGKTLKGTTSDAKLRIWHTKDGTRKACVVSGTVEAK